MKLNEAIRILDEKTRPGVKQETSTNDILKEGLIQRFEYTHELAWSLMKDYAEYQEKFDIKGSRDATREAFKMGLIEKADQWMDMLQSRNLTSHTYNQDTAEEIIGKITGTYQFLFNGFEKRMQALRSGPQTGIFEKDI